MSAKTIGTLIVVVILVIAIIYIAKKLNLIKIPDFLNPVFNFIDKAKEAIQDALEDAGKAVNDFTKSAQEATKDIKPFETTGKFDDKKSGSTVETSKTTATTTTAIQSEGTIDKDTGEFKLAKPQTFKIDLKETLTVTQKDVEKVIIAKSESQSIADQQANLRQFAIIQKNPDIPLMQAIESGRLKSPLQENTNPFDQFIKALEGIFATPVSTPIVPRPVILPVGI